MADIVLRLVKGSPLTNAELDANFSNLNTELGQKLVASLNLSDLTSASTARTNLGLGNVENKSSATIRSELTSSNVTTALGFTPYDATNPSGYITSAALSPYLLSSTASSTYLPLSGGTLTGGLTLNGGAANGLAYLNGSKVLTAGSALTFDGTNFATTGTASATKLIPTGNVTAGSGMYAPYADGLAFSTAGIERLQISNIGHVGIGGYANKTGIQNGTVLTVTGANGTNPAAISGVIELVNEQTAASNNRLGEFRYTSGAVVGASLASYLEGSGGANGFGANLRFFTKPDNVASIPERMRITNAGDVGIGTISPEYKLSVHGANVGINLLETGSTYSMAFRGNALDPNVYDIKETNANRVAISFNTGSQHIAFLTAGSSRVLINSSGNVGVGTELPSYRLSAKQSGNTGNASLGLVSIDSATDTFIGIGYDATSDTNRIFSSYLSTGSFKPMSFWTADARRLTIDTSGNVIVGGTTAISKVTSFQNFGNSASASFAASSLGTAQGQLAGYSFWPTFQGTSDNNPRRAADIWSGFNQGAWGAEFLAFGVGGSNDTSPVTSEKMRITNAGNVGIGTSSPNASYRLHVQGNILAAGTLRIEGSQLRVAGSSSAAAPSIQPGEDGDTGMFWPSANIIGLSTAGTERMRIDSSGNVGIGTSSPAARLGILQASTTAYGLISNTPTVGLTAGNYVNMAYFANGRGPSNDGLRIVNVRDSNGSGIGNWETESYRIRRSVDQSDGSSGVQEEIVFGTNLLAFNTTGVERARIDSSGNVGIGTTNTTYRLNVAGGRTTLASNSNQYALGLGYSSGAAYWLGSDAANTDLVMSDAGGTERLRVFGANGSLSLAGGQYRTGLYVSHSFTPAADKWYRLCTLSTTNQTQSVEFVFANPGQHILFNVKFSKTTRASTYGGGILEVELLGSYSYGWAHPYKWRVVEGGTNAASHIDIQFPNASGNALNWRIQVLNSWAGDVSHASFPMTDMGTAAGNGASNFGVVIGSGSNAGWTMQWFKLNSGNGRYAYLDNDLSQFSAAASSY